MTGFALTADSLLWNATVEGMLCSGCLAILEAEDIQSSTKPVEVKENKALGENR